MPLKVGDRAPEFTLPDASGERISLASFRRRPVVLVFLRWLG
jgi:peroxiredoxin